MKFSTHKPFKPHTHSTAVVLPKDWFNSHQNPDELLMAYELGSFLVVIPQGIVDKARLRDFLKQMGMLDP